jgi:hypothetical protein
MVQLIGVTIFQFAVSIVDPSILAQPLDPGDLTVGPRAGLVTTVTMPASSRKSATPEGSGPLAGTAGILQQGATRPMTLPTRSKSR